MWYSIWWCCYLGFICFSTGMPVLLFLLPHVAGFFSFYVSSSSYWPLENFPAGGAGSSLWFLLCRHCGLLSVCQKLAFISTSGVHTEVSGELGRCGFSTWGTVGAHGSGGEVPECGTLRGSWGNLVWVPSAGKVSLICLFPDFPQFWRSLYSGFCWREMGLSDTPGITNTPCCPFPWRRWCHHWVDQPGAVFPCREGGELGKFLWLPLSVATKLFLKFPRMACCYLLSKAGLLQGLSHARVSALSPPTPASWFTGSPGSTVQTEVCLPVTDEQVSVIPPGSSGV